MTVPIAFDCVLSDVLNALHTSCHLLLKTTYEVVILQRK